MSCDSKVDVHGKDYEPPCDPQCMSNVILYAPRAPPLASPPRQRSAALHPRVYGVLDSTGLQFLSPCPQKGKSPCKAPLLISFASPVENRFVHAMSPIRQTTTTIPLTLAMIFT
ncbi:unnamed protein product [Cuscuta europaea]|uniref:Uncharacterized protein n=1 Tax=Cuscuta europaea TaxID=41803 RepID=A0A9P1E953_CUSEU|nr:unnamed protein product [Cuscuta europaea]